MKLNIKAALLSAFVLPGIGQIHSGHRVKGGILIFLANIFLLAAFFVILKEMGPVFLEAKLSGKVDVAAVTQKLASGAPAAKVLLSLFFALWAYGVIDALLGGRKHDEEGDDHP